ncbi:MAG: type II secretion system F family protein [Deltaproteobacteria bacterium]|nr:type II secretion system F family protein [Deltaproteobacteria bacterium]
MGSVVVGLLVSVLGGAAVFAVLWAAYLALMRAPAAEATAARNGTPRANAERREADFLVGLARWSPRAPAFAQRYQSALQHAGFQRPEHVDGFFGLMVVGALAGIVFGAVVVPTWSLAPGLQALWMLIAPMAGLVLPVFWLRVRERERQAEIARTLPDALDLMKICLEAGLAMEPAMTRVGEELGKRRAVLGRELILTSRQIQAGRSRADALHALASRCGVPELSNVVMLLNQTERMGMGVGDVLRTAADTSRTRRLQRAETEAARTSVKMIFPLALFLLPAMLLVVLGPAFLQLQRGLAPLLGGP